MARLSWYPMRDLVSLATRGPAPPSAGEPVRTQFGRGPGLIVSATHVGGGCLLREVYALVVWGW